MDHNDFDINLDCNNRSPTRDKSAALHGPSPCSSEKCSELYQLHTAHYLFDKTDLDKLDRQRSRCNILEPFVSNLPSSNCQCRFHSLYLKYERLIKKIKRLTSLPRHVVCEVIRIIALIQNILLKVLLLLYLLSHEPFDVSVT